MIPYMKYLARLGKFLGTESRMWLPEAGGKDGDLMGTEFQSKKISKF